MENPTVTTVTTVTNFFIKRVETSNLYNKKFVTVVTVVTVGFSIENGG